MSTRREHPLITPDQIMHRRPTWQFYACIQPYNSGNWICDVYAAHNDEPVASTEHPTHTSALAWARADPRIVKVDTI